MREHLRLIKSSQADAAAASGPAPTATATPSAENLAVTVVQQAFVELTAEKPSAQVAARADVTDSSGSGRTLSKMLPAVVASAAVPVPAVSVAQASREPGVLQPDMEAILAALDESIDTAATEALEEPQPNKRPHIQAPQ